MLAAKILISIALVFAALSLGCAVWIGRRRDSPADPFAQPFGEMPGFTDDELRRIAPVPRTSDPQRRSFETSKTCRITMTSSDRPRVGDDDMRRRLLIIPFPSTDPVRLALRSRDTGGAGSYLHPDPGAARLTLHGRPHRG